MLFKEPKGSKYQIINFPNGMKIIIDYDRAPIQEVKNSPANKDPKMIWKNGRRCDDNIQRVRLYDEKGKLLTTSIEEITWDRGGHPDAVPLRGKIRYLENEILKLKDQLNENGIHCDY
jgi:hypothetical protein